jgi:dodecin
VRLASQSLPNIRGVEVLSSNADVDDAGNLTLYKVQCKIAFLVEPAQVGQTAGWDLPTATQT